MVSFLLPTIAVTRTTISGLKWVKRDVDVKSQNLSFKAQLGVKNLLKGRPYNYSCPVVQDLVNRRLC